LPEAKHKIFCSAGELSGDIHAAALIVEASHRHPELSFFGLGGKEMEKAGFRLLHSMEETAVMGFTEIISSLPRILKVRRSLSKAIKEERPEAVLLIDSPDLNFHLAKVAFSLNIPVIYYICPQIWAWRAGRIKFLKRFTKRRALIFPFEKNYYEERKVSCDLVGHPLLDEIVALPKVELRAKLNLAEDSPVLGIFPGSRLGMFKELSPVMFETAFRLWKLIPDLRLLVAMAPTLTKELYQKALAPYPEMLQNVQLLVSQSREILGASDAALLSSGTSVMEATILGTPMVVAYKVSALSWFLARALVKVPFAAINNLIAGRRVVGEYLQEDCAPDKLTNALLPLLTGGPQRELMIHELSKIRASLGGPGASKRVLSIIAQETGLSQ
jgi:lipid-A-disaccharide synthase